MHNFVSLSSHGKGKILSSRRDWSKMNDNTIGLIVRNFKYYPHICKAAAACESWYKVTKEIHATPRKTSLFMLLPFDKEREACSFYFNSETYSLKLPELRDKQIHGCTKGWLVTTDGDFRVILVNPLTHAQIRFPKLTKVTKSDGGVETVVKPPHIAKFVASDPFSETCIAAAIMADQNSLFICRLGNASWTPVSSVVCDFYERIFDICEYLEDMVFFEGKIYAVSRNVYLIVICNLCSSNEGKLRHISKPYISYIIRHAGITFMVSNTYLVECSGGLLIVFKYSEYSLPTKPEKLILFHIYKFDEDTTSWSRIHELGDKSLFLGANESFSISGANFPGCKPNSVYYTNHKPVSMGQAEIRYEFENGVYSLDDDSFTTFKISHSMDSWKMPAMWFQQSDM